MKKVLVVIDCQNDFIDAALGTKEATAAVDAVVKKIETYPREDVFATRDTHETNYSETREGRFLPVVHCVKGTSGWEINDRVKAALGDATIIDKPTFGSEELVNTIKKHYAGEDIAIELIGFCTDICVISNALMLKAAFYESDITVDSACCAGVTPKLHEEALDVMKSCQIVVK